METLQTGFIDLKRQQTKNIAIAIFNLYRYSKMNDKGILAEVGGKEVTSKKGDELRRYVVNKEMQDISSAQANIRLLSKLEKDYGEKNNKGSLVADLQRDFGITGSTKD